MARKVELTVLPQSKEALRNSRVGPFIFRTNEARPHLLAGMIMLDRQEEAVLVGADLGFSRGDQI